MCNITYSQQNVLKAPSKTKTRFFHWLLDNCRKQSLWPTKVYDSYSFCSSW